MGKWGFRWSRGGGWGFWVFRVRVFFKVVFWDFSRFILIVFMFVGEIEVVVVVLGLGRG